MGNLFNSIAAMTDQDKIKRLQTALANLVAASDGHAGSVKERTQARALLARLNAS